VALDVNRTLFTVSNEHTIKLHYALPWAFPLPYDLRLLSLGNQEQTQSEVSLQQQPHSKESQARALERIFGLSSLVSSGNIVVGDNLMKFNLLPHSRLGLDWSPTEELNSRSLYHHTFNSLCRNADLNEALDKLLPSTPHGRLLSSAQPHWTRGWSDKRTQVVFLGTVASCSTPVRTESCIFVDIPGYGGLILDAGSGAYQQMVHTFCFFLHSFVCLSCVWSNVEADKALWSGPCS